MKTLFHGGSDIITTPEIRVPNRTLDFGSGFYLTSSLNQAQDWVHRRFHNIDSDIIGYVNEYELDLTRAKNVLNIKIFDNADDKWLDFVMYNRKNPEFKHDFDIVIGPVANDRVYTAFSLYEAGTIGKDTLIAELKTYRLVDQYLLHTQEALEHINFIKATVVRL